MKFQNRPATAGSLFSFLLAGIGIAAFSAPDASAQGLSGPSQRLEETLEDSEPGGRNDRGGDSGYDTEMEVDMMEDMEDYDGYGDMQDQYDIYGTGAGGGVRGRGRSSDEMLFYGISNSGSTLNIDLSSLFAPQLEDAIQAGPVLKRESDLAFAAGNYPLALELAFGHMAAEYPNSVVDLKTVKYSSTLRRPVWNARFGVSMTVRGTGALREAQPIRETTSGRQLAQNRGQGRSARGGYEGFDEEMMDMEEDMEMQMEEMRDEEMMMEMDMSDFGGSDPRSRRSSGRPQSTGPVRKMLDDAAKEELDSYLGLVAEVIGEAFKKRFQSGDFGPALITVNMEEAEEGDVLAGRQGAATPPPSGVTLNDELEDVFAAIPDPLPMWLPGIVYLGQGASDEIIPVAQSADLDFVLHFDVVLKQGRNEMVQNISRCRLIQVSNGKLLGVSKGMDSWEAAQLASSGRSGERAYVEEKLANLLMIIDRSAKTAELPALSSKVARQRVASLLGGKKSRSLRTLAEIRLYHAQELIGDADVEIAFDIVGGPEALTMLHGTPAQRVAMVRKWAVRSLGGQTDH